MKIEPPYGISEPVPITFKTVVLRTTLELATPNRKAFEDWVDSLSLGDRQTHYAPPL
jgi:hypothetical protein